MVRVCRRLDPGDKQRDDNGGRCGGKSRGTHNHCHPGIHCRDPTRRRLYSRPVGTTLSRKAHRLKLPSKKQKLSLKTEGQLVINDRRKTMRTLHASLTLFIAVAALTAIAPAFAAQQVGEPCGSRAQITCAKGLWCEPPAGLCSVAERLGKCQTAPQVCTREYIPVCGCNSVTYGNECTRRSARVGLDYKGECLTPKSSGD
ncbi:MAG: Kazal-type serine protease inhibitor family protein [Pseudomonadota bacterium]